MVLLDKLLPKLKERDSRVLIFSQVSCCLESKSWVMHSDNSCRPFFCMPVHYSITSFSLYLMLYFCGWGTFYLKFRWQGCWTFLKITWCFEDTCIVELMEIQGEKIVMPPLMHLINPEVRNLCSYCQLELEVLVSILLLQMLSSFMTVTGEHFSIFFSFSFRMLGNCYIIYQSGWSLYCTVGTPKLICKHKIVLIGLVKRKKFKCFDSAQRFILFLCFALSYLKISYINAYFFFLG